MALNNAINTASLGNGFVHSDGLGGLTASAGIKITKYTANNTWTKDSKTVSVTVLAWSAGSGGGSGRQALSTTSGGGCGGASGTFLMMSSPAAFFNSTETVTIGAGGAGGLTQGSTSTNGNAGTTGGNTSIGGIIAFNNAGSGGGGGTTTSATQGNLGTANNFSNLFGVSWFPNNSATIVGSNGAPGDQTPLNLSPSGNTGGATVYMPTIGGPGSGANSVSAQQAGRGSSILQINDMLGTNFSVLGGAGGIASGTINGGNGIDAVSTTGGRYFAATGGGGGGGSTVGAAGIGGDGGIPGGGGGGGGGSINGTTSGAGGAGGRGELWVIEYLG